VADWRQQRHNESQAKYKIKQQRLRQNNNCAGPWWRCCKVLFTCNNNISSSARKTKKKKNNSNPGQQSSEIELDTTARREIKTKTSKCNRVIRHAGAKMILHKPNLLTPRQFGPQKSYNRNWNRNHEQRHLPAFSYYRAAGARNTESEHNGGHNVFWNPNSKTKLVYIYGHIIK